VAEINEYDRNSAGDLLAEGFIRSYANSLGQTYDPPFNLYRLSFAAQGQRAFITEEVIEEHTNISNSDAEQDFYYRFQDGKSVINAEIANASPEPARREKRDLDRKNFKSDESILMQLKDWDAYPDLTQLDTILNESGVSASGALGAMQKCENHSQLTCLPMTCIRLAKPWINPQPTRALGCMVRIQRLFEAVSTSI